jgi:hypothetical protein
MGQVHGSWGCAIHTDTDSYELITEEQAKAELSRQAEVNRPKVSGFGSAEVPFVVHSWCREFREYRDVDCSVAVHFKANGERGVWGIGDCDVSHVLSEVSRVCGIPNVSVYVVFTPQCVRKTFNDCVEPLRKAVRLAMKA